MIKRTNLFLLVAIISTSFVAVCGARRECRAQKKDAITKSIQLNQQELEKLPIETAAQMNDSISAFDAESENYQILQAKKQQELQLQMRILNLAEQSWREYWIENFPKYKKYIDSRFYKSELNQLKKCVGNTHFTLSCDVDTDYFVSLDQILYGPYWREFADSADISNRLRNKYIRVHMDANKKYPYIFTKNVFYDGESLTVSDGDTETVAFSNAVRAGLAYMAELDSVRKMDSVMIEFNSLRNVSKVFTTDLDYFLKSVNLRNFGDERKEYLNLQSSLFAEHYEELLDYVKNLIGVSREAQRRNKLHEKEVAKIKQYFATNQQKIAHEKYERIAELNQQLNQMTK